jgi:N-acylneuraminate cytidylyltransferase
MHKILVIIPARGGSKRLPQKNIRKLNGKPLVVWSIDVAKDIPEICDILVSTDDPSTAEICRLAGAYVPWLRPKEIASDSASGVDVALHALDWYENAKGAIDGVLLLQPTSPFRTLKNVKLGIELFLSDKTKPVVGVSENHFHPLWTFKLHEKILVPYLKKHGMKTRSQDLPPAYIVNGSFYLIAPSILRKRKNFFSSKCIPLFASSPEEGIDIDTEADFRYAEFIVGMHSKPNE